MKFDLFGSAYRITDVAFRHRLAKLCHRLANLHVLILAMLLLVLLTGSGGAQSPCPTVDFLIAETVSLKPSPTSHMFVVRQDDGSFTGYELADGSPRRIIRTTPHMEKQFAACLPHMIPDAPAPSTANSLQLTSQPQAVARLRNGNYAAIRVEGTPSIYFDAFDSQLRLVSEYVFSLKPEAPGRVGLFSSVLFADVNGDGELDVVAVAGSSVLLSRGAIWIFFGNGDGTFQDPSMYPLPGIISSSVAVGDLNGDGKPDLAVAISGFSAQQGQISILRNLGDGIFAPGADLFANTISPNSVALADLNGDGQLDLVFSTSDTTLPSRLTEVGIAFGKGDGTFGPLIRFPVRGYLGAVGDVNGDGIPDIVTNGVSILFGDGEGGFSNRRDFLHNGSGTTMLTDFDGDGELDIVIGAGNPTFFAGNSLTVLFGKGGGSFVTAPVTNINGACPPYCEGVSLATSDFNLDGIPDLLYAHYARVSPNDTGALTVLQGKGDGTFIPVFQYDLSKPNEAIRPISVVSADFNHDGTPDVAAAIDHVYTTGEAIVFLGNGDGTLRSPSVLPIPGVGIRFIAAADLNSDGNIDIAVLTSTSIFSDAKDAVWIYFGKGDGTFSSPVSFPAGPAAISMVVGDFNSDGKLDIAIANSGSTPQTCNVSLLLGKGDGTFVSGTSVPVAASSLRSNNGILGPMKIITADFNGDGRLDLAAILGSSSGEYGGFSVLIGKGDGTFQPPLLRPELVQTITAGDFNGDGIPDLADETAIFIGNGDGTFQTAVRISSTPLTAPVAADFNGDGTIDLAGAISGPNVAALLNLTQPGPVPTLTVVNAATFTPGPLAVSSIAAVFGKNLASNTASADSNSLPNTLAGTTVTIEDSTGVSRPAQLFYVSPNQVNFLVPPGLASGTATLMIKGSNRQTLTAQVRIAPVAPALFTVGRAGIAAAYAVTVGPGNTQATQPVFTVQNGNFVTSPIDVSTGNVYLVLFGTGFDAVDATSVSARIQGVDSDVSYAGPQQSLAGLDQVNIRIPSTLAGTKVVSVDLTIGGIRTNTVYIEVK
jgi:uncharacterized protein (TIGR03437 family)